MGWVMVSVSGFFRCGLLALSLVGVSAQASESTLRLHGSNTLGAKLGPQLLAAFARSQGYVGVETVETAALEYRIDGRKASATFQGLVRAHGTNTGYQDLLTSEADIWMASRQASPVEIAGAVALGDLAAPEQEHVVALDGLAIIVHPDNPVDQLDVSQVRDAFAGRLTNWAQMGGPNRPIRLYGRDDKSGTFDSFKSMVLSADATIAANTRRFESSSDLEAQVAADPEALGFVGFSYVQKSKPLAVFAKETTPLKPTPLSIATEDYLLARRLYFYTRPDAPSVVTEFLQFVQSDAGQAVVAGAGFVAQQIFVADAEPMAGNPDGYYDVVQETARLSINFRFRPQSSSLDSRALRDVERLTQFMRRPENRQKQLRLAGFALGDGRAKIRTSLMVNDRIDFLAQLLAIQGVPTHMSRAFVDGAAVAPLDQSESRARNERVEVWLFDPRAERSGDQTM
jgi:phosphate transport system substrate-binding protein